MLSDNHRGCANILLIETHVERNFFFIGILNVQLYTSIVLKLKRMVAAHSICLSDNIESVMRPNPICCSFGSHRLYIYSHLHIYIHIDIHMNLKLRTEREKKNLSSQMWALFFWFDVLGTFSFIVSDSLAIIEP